MQKIFAEVAEFAQKFAPMAQLELWETERKFLEQDLGQKRQNPLNVVEEAIFIRKEELWIK